MIRLAIRRLNGVGNSPSPEDVPLPPEKGWSYAEDLTRYSEWLTIHWVERSQAPDELTLGRENRAASRESRHARRLPAKLSRDRQEHLPPLAATG